MLSPSILHVFVQELSLAVFGSDWIARSLAAVWREKHESVVTECTDFSRKMGPWNIGNW